jgi:AAA domain
MLERILAPFAPALQAAMAAVEGGDGCCVGIVKALSFAEWMAALTSEEKNQFTPEQITVLAEDGDWTFEERQAAEWYSVDPSAEADFGKIDAREQGAEPESEPFFDDDIHEEIRREDREANPIKLISYAEMVALPEGEFLIHGVIVRLAKNVLFGPSNSFKSFMATDMGGSVSTGRSYHGMAVKKCPVIYVANEGANAVGRKRIPAWMAAHGIPQDQRGNIYLVNVETILPNETSRNNLLAAIRYVVEPGDDFFLIIDVLRGRNVSTTLRQPAFEFKLGFPAFGLVG